MYKLDYRFKLLTTHFDKKPGEIAHELGVPKKELLKWLKEENSVPVEKMDIVSSYFNLDTDEFYEEVNIQIGYAMLSQMSNQLKSALNQTKDNQDYAQLAQEVEEFSKLLIQALIDGQVQLNLK